MHTRETQSQRHQRRQYRARGLSLLIALAACAVDAQAQAFTSISPSAQSVAVGETASVDVIFNVPTSAAYGIGAWIRFDPSKLQVISVASGAGSPFETVSVNSYDNTAGTIHFEATTGDLAGIVYRRSVTAVTIVFEAVSAGSSAVSYQKVNQFFYAAGFLGPYDVTYRASGGSITVEPPPEPFFVDSLVGPASPNLDIPFDKYAYTPAGLQRIQSVGETDRPMVFTDADGYLAAPEFTAEVTVALANNDLLYFGLGQGDTDPAYFNEPNHAFYFRVHSGWQGNYSIQADARGPGVFSVTEVGQYSLGSIITLRIVRSGDNVTMSVVGGGSVTYSLSAHFAALGLTDSNTRVFLGNTSTGSVFSLLSITEGSGDTTPPVITAPADITAEAAGPAGAMVAFAATAVDDVDGPVAVFADPSSGSTFAIGTTVVDLGASDAAGNEAYAEFNVTVQDTTSPAITLPADITAEATGPDGAAATFSATAVDIVDGPVAVLANPSSGSTFAIGTTVVDVGASDAAGNEAYAEFNVTVQDTTPPAITPPANITAEATGPDGAAVTFSATAVDIIDGPVAVLANPSSGSTFAIGTTVVGLSATDAAGNEVHAEFNVTVQDTTPPAITPPADITAEATGPDGAAVTFSATAVDIIDGPVAVLANPSSGSTFAIGTTVVGLGATDAAGNEVHAEFNVTVQDTTPPVITSVTPSTATLWPPNHQMVPVAVNAVASDNTGVTSLRIVSVTSSEPDNGLGDGDTANDVAITGDLSVNLRAERGGNGSGRTYTITIEARDAFGNASTATTSVFVPKSRGRAR